MIFHFQVDLHWCRLTKTGRDLNFDKNHNLTFFSKFFLIFDLKWLWTTFELTHFNSCGQELLFKDISRFITFSALDWALEELLKRFILRYNLSTIEKDWNLTYIQDLWPHMSQVTWPLSTSRLLLLKSCRQGRHFDI